MLVEGSYKNNDNVRLKSATGSQWLRLIPTRYHVRCHIIFVDTLIDLNAVSVSFRCFLCKYGIF